MNLGSKEPLLRVLDSSIPDALLPALDMSHDCIPEVGLSFNVMTVD